MAHSTNLQNQIGPSHMQKLLIYKTNLSSQVIYIDTSPSTPAREGLQLGRLDIFAEQTKQSRPADFPTRIANSLDKWMQPLPTTY